MADGLLSNESPLEFFKAQVEGAMERQHLKTSVWTSYYIVQMLTAYVAGSSAVLARVSPIMRVLEAAVANDPEVAALWPQDEDLRYVVQRAAADALVSKPGARDGLTADEAADLIYGILSPELYLLFTRDRAWSHDRWLTWATQTLHTQLCA